MVEEKPPHDQEVVGLNPQDFFSFFYLFIRSFSSGVTRIRSLHSSDSKEIKWGMFLKQKDSVLTSLNFSPRNVFAFSGKVGNPRLWKRLRLDGDEHSGN